MNIKDWYIKEYPSDKKIGQDINPYVGFRDCYEQMQQGKDFYEIVGVADSIVRERVFHKMSEILDIDYNKLYIMWLNRPRH